MRSRLLLVVLLALICQTSVSLRADEKVQQFRVGMIGLDTSHCLAFTELLNKAGDDPLLGGCKVVLVYPKGSPDIESSVKRVPEYTQKIRALGVEVVEDLASMISQVDVVLLETNDGRPHLEQVIPVLKARKPVFIDKPVAGSLVDAIAIYRLAEHYQTPVFSSSSLRFAAAAQAVRSAQSARCWAATLILPAALKPHIRICSGTGFTAARRCLQPWGREWSQLCEHPRRISMWSPVSGRADGSAHFVAYVPAVPAMAGQHSVPKARLRWGPMTATNLWWSRL